MLEWASNETPSVASLMSADPYGLVESAEEALAKLASCSTVVVLCDLGLPGIRLHAKSKREALSKARKKGLL